MWKLVNKWTRCSSCGRMVERAWTFFETPTLWSTCFCETCAEEKTQ